LPSISSLPKTCSRKLATLLTFARLAENCKASPVFGANDGSAATFFAAGALGRLGPDSGTLSKGASLGGSVAWVMGVKETTFGDLPERKCNHTKAAAPRTMAAAMANLRDALPFMLLLGRFFLANRRKSIFRRTISLWEPQDLLLEVA